MTYIHEDDMQSIIGTSAAQDDWDAMWHEVTTLTQPVHFRSHGTCTLIECVRDGKPIFQGDPRLSEVPF
jgi:hypothetical protein